MLEHHFGRTASSQLSGWQSAVDGRGRRIRFFSLDSPGDFAYSTHPMDGSANPRMVPRHAVASVPLLGTSSAILAACGKPAFLTTVCHCLEQAVPGQRVTLGTACSKQWHTVGQSPRIVRNADYARAFPSRGTPKDKRGCLAVAIILAATFTLLAAGGCSSSPVSLRSVPKSPLIDELNLASYGGPKPAREPCNCCGCTTSATS